MKRLAQNSGQLLDVAGVSASGEQSPESIDKQAILVHAGTFESQDGPIVFDAARIQRVVDVNNDRLIQLAKEYSGQIPIGAYRPIQEDHKETAKSTIGRLIGPFAYEERDIPNVGKGIACVVAHTLKFIGDETVKRVKDGRIYNLSVGINPDDTIDELSAVAFPAAPGAMLLARGKPTKTPNKGDKDMSMKRLQAVAESRARLSAMRTKFTETQTTVKATQEKMRLAQKRAGIKAELSELMKLGKLTPAEFKAASIEEMSALDEKSLKVCLSAYKNRTAAVIEGGQRGSSDAIEVGKIAEQAGEKALLARTRDSIMKLSGKKLKSAKLSEQDQKVEEKMKKHMASEAPAVAEQSEADKEAKMKHMEEYKAHCAALMQHLESGNVEKAKECAQKLSEYADADTKGMKHMALGEDADAYKAAMSQMQEQVDALTTQMAKLFEEVDKMTAVEQEEGHDLEESDEEKEKKKLAAEEEQKKLADEKSKEKPAGHEGDAK